MFLRTREDAFDVVVFTAAIDGASEVSMDGMTVVALMRSRQRHLLLEGRLNDVGPSALRPRVSGTSSSTVMERM